MISSFSLMIIALIELGDQSKDGLRNFREFIMGFVSFVLCIKGFYFLRLWREYGYFVNMLVEVVKHSKVFFLLYILIALQFGFTFYFGQYKNTNPLHFLVQGWNIGLGTSALNEDGFEG